MPTHHPRSSAFILLRRSRSTLSRAVGGVLPRRPTGTPDPSALPFGGRQAAAEQCSCEQGEGHHLAQQGGEVAASPCGATAVVGAALSHLRHFAPKECLPVAAL